MVWRKIEDEEFTRMLSGRRRTGRRRERWNTKKLYKDLLELEPGSTNAIELEEFINEYGLDLEGMPEKQIKKSLRGRLRYAMKKGILEYFSTFGDKVIVKRSPIPKEELEEEFEFEESLYDLEE